MQSARLSASSLFRLGINHAQAWYILLVWEKCFANTARYFHSQLYPASHTAVLRAQLGNLSSSQLTAQHQLTPPRTTAPELGAWSAQLQEVLSVLVSCQPQGTLNDQCALCRVMKSFPEVQNWNLIGTGAQRAFS